MKRARRVGDIESNGPQGPGTGVNEVTGTIRKILKDKGFGFIEPDDGGDDVFFHRSSGAPRVRFEDFGEGDSVQFQTRAGDKGPVAFGMKLR